MRQIAHIAPTLLPQERASLVGPATAAADVSRVGSADAVPISDLLKGQAATPYFGCDFDRQLGTFGPLARGVLFGPTALGRHVSGVIEGRPKEEVIRIDAAPIVASVAHQKLAWISPIRQRPRNTVGEVVLLRSELEKVVALRVRRSFPAPGCFVERQVVSQPLFRSIFAQGADRGPDIQRRSYH